MERSFSVEAKLFRLSVKVECPNLRLEERRKGFVGYIFASSQCSEWLVETVESAMLTQEKEEIAKTFREGEKAMMVHGGANKSGRFLEVSFVTPPAR
jgi:predicted DNA-binding transcriptional regulator